MTDVQPWWSVPGHREVRDGDLYISGVRVQDIIDDYEPEHLGERVIFVYSVPWFEYNADVLQQELAGADVLYAEKALNRPEIIAAAARKGLRADAVSPIAVELCIKMGIAPSNILMTYNATPLGMAYAAQKGVPINMNSTRQLEQFGELADRYPSLFDAFHMYRVNSKEKGAGSNDDTVTVDPDSKFGMMEESVVSTAGISLQRGLRHLHGLHKHIGSCFGADHADVYVWHANRLAELTARVQDVGAPVDRVDYGGGFGIVYDHRNEKPLDVAALHQEVMANHIRLLGDSVTPMYEPGRRLADCGLALMRIGSIGEEYIRFVHLNAGFPDFPRQAMYKAYQEMVPVTDTLRKGGDHSVQLAGRVCESGDVFTTGKHEQRLMPPMREGEWVALLQIPYGTTMRMASRDGSYCMFPPPLDLVITEGGIDFSRHPGEFVNMEHPEYFDAFKQLDAA